MARLGRDVPHEPSDDRVGAAFDVRGGDLPRSVPAHVNDERILAVSARNDVDRAARLRLHYMSGGLVGRKDYGVALAY